MTDATRAFVTGWPLDHSRSPLIHNAWLKAHGLEGSYEAVPVSPNDLSPFLRSVGKAFAGGNVTIPHKEATFETCDRLTERAAAIGAVNTVWHDDGLWGDNTDGHGFLANLDERAPGWDHDAGAAQAIVLGAGGASLAIVHALVERGFGHIVVVNRTLARAEAMKRFGPSVRPCGWDDLPSRLSDARLLVNTTSLGMNETSEAYPPDLSTLPDDAVVTDLVYAPLRTPLLRAASERGLANVDGLGMLLHQAVPGFERWFGVRPRATAKLRRLVLHDLGEREPIFLALTGSIGMGKSTTAAMFRELRVPVHDADATVHDLYASEAIPLVEAAFPGTTNADGVDRDALSRAVVGKPEAMKRLEAIVHPLVHARERAFRERVVREGHPLAVLDIPLLFETGGEARADAVVVVTAPEQVQRERVLSRPGMTPERFEGLLARQMPDAEKRRKADFAIDTSRGLDHAREGVRQIVETLKGDWLPDGP